MDPPAPAPEPPKPAKAKPKAKKSAAPTEPALAGAGSRPAALGNSSHVPVSNGSTSKAKEAQPTEAGSPADKYTADSLSLPLQVLESVKATVEQIFSSDRGGKARMDKDDATLQRVATIISRVALARGWRTWKGNWQLRTLNMEIIKSSLRHLIQQPLSRAWNHWRSRAEGRTRSKQLLSVALPFLKMHERITGFRAWKAMTAQRAKLQRFDETSLSKLERMRQKEVATAFGEWKKERLLGKGRGFGICTAFQRACAKCSFSA